MWSLFKKAIKEAPNTNSNLPAPIKNDLALQFQIPEPTKSLLWVTDENPSKIASPLGIKISFDLSSKNVNIDDGHNYFGEPSLIWTKLPLQPNSELETKAMYYPSYSGLSPKNRFQYLNWLRDVTQETNLSYVFLYYYGLERHMLVGNYDLAVDEILRLIKYHNKSSFKAYAINSLILASGYRKRADIVKKAPFILNDPTPAALYIQYIAKDPLSAKEVINLANRVNYSNKRYIKAFPDLFERELQSIIDDYENTNGSIWDVVNINKLKENSYAYIANFSIPDNIRTIKIASPIDDLNFKSLLREFLKTAHIRIKEMKRIQRFKVH